MSPERDALQHHMTQCGIQTQIHYPLPPHKQQCYSQWAGLSCPIAEKLSAEELSLPLYPLLTDDEVRLIISAVNSF